MKSTEPEHRLVDYLYDELGEADRKAFAAELKGDGDAEAEVSTYASLLKLYREESEEITPTVAATERILAEARRASRPWYATLFGDWLPSLLVRPAVGIAAVAVLVVGFGVFAFLSGRPSPDTGVASRGGASRGAASLPEAPKPASTTTVAEGAAAPVDGRGFLELGKASGGAPADSTVASDQAGAVALGHGNAAKDKVDALKQGQKDGLDDRNQRDARQDATKDEKKLEEQNLDTPRRSALRFKAGFAGKGGLKQPSVGSGALTRTGGGGRSGDPGNAPAAAPQAPPPRGTNVSVSNRAPAYKQQLAAGETVGAQAATPKPVSKATKSAPQSAPVLYNRATTSLAKGRVAEACALFASLVRGYRSYTRRADALLGWARCEMARGAFGRAEAVVQQLIKEHPSWRKSGEAWLAEIQKQRQQAVLRAQQRARVRRQMKAAPRRAAARPSQQTSQ